MMLKFRKFKTTDTKTLKKLVSEYYKADPPVAPLSWMDISKTIKELKKYPALGQIIVFEKDSQIIGYSILMNYWSNEFGGYFILIDELYIKPQFQKQGIGTKFFQFMKRKHSKKPIAIGAEIHEENIHVKKFYEKLGFVHDNILMKYTIKK